MLRKYLAALTIAASLSCTLTPGIQTAPTIPVVLTQNIEVKKEQRPVAKIYWDAYADEEYRALRKKYPDVTTDLETIINGVEPSGGTVSCYS